jgi:hypothetical protein
MNMVAATQPTWTETLSLRVGEIRRQAIDINLYEIIDPGAGELSATTAGSQVTIHVGDRLIRQYSLTEPAEIAATFTVVIASTGARVNASMSRRIAALRIRLMRMAAFRCPPNVCPGSAAPAGCISRAPSGVLVLDR